MAPFGQRRRPSTHSTPALLLAAAAALLLAAAPAVATKREYDWKWCAGRGETCGGGRASCSLRPPCRARRANPRPRPPPRTPPARRRYGARATYYVSLALRAWSQQQHGACALAWACTWCRLWAPPWGAPLGPVVTGPVCMRRGRLADCNPCCCGRLHGTQGTDEWSIHKGACRADGPRAPRAMRPLHGMLCVHLCRRAPMHARAQQDTRAPCPGSCGYGYLYKDEPLGWDVAAVTDFMEGYEDVSEAASAACMRGSSACMLAGRGGPHSQHCAASCASCHASACRPAAHTRMQLHAAQPLATHMRSS